MKHLKLYLVLVLIAFVAFGCSKTPTETETPPTPTTTTLPTTQQDPLCGHHAQGCRQHRGHRHLAGGLSRTRRFSSNGFKKRPANPTSIFKDRPGSAGVFTRTQLLLFQHYRPADGTSTYSLRNTISPAFR